MSTESNTPERLDNQDTAIRLFDAQTDMAAVLRIWQEVGWIDDSDKKPTQDFFTTGRTLCAELNGAVECAVLTQPGRMRYQETDIDLCVVAAVTTSRIARRLGFAQQLTAQQLAHAAEQGAAVAALGMFDQGFYDKVGFGTGSYENYFGIDPSTLDIPHHVYRTPERLEVEDYEIMHQAMATRLRGHGGCVIEPALAMRSELDWSEGGFGLGLRTGHELTHFMWLESKGEHGPYRVTHMAYRSVEQLLELLALLQALGDQVYCVNIVEPPEIQLQTLLKKPMRTRGITRNSPQVNRHSADAWWQLRILDVVKCVAALTWSGRPLSFNLELTDPVADMLTSPTSAWSGVQGNYRIDVTQPSSAQRVVALDPNLPTLSATVNAFTRVWFGVAAGDGLRVTDGVRAPSELLSELANVLRVGSPHTGWDF